MKTTKTAMENRERTTKSVWKEVMAVTGEMSRKHDYRQF